MQDLKFKTLTIAPGERELLAALLARLATWFDQHVDEYEAFDIADEFLKENDLDVVSLDTLARMLKTTKFDPSKNLWS